MEGFCTAGHIIYYILCHADGILNNAFNMHVMLLLFSDSHSWLLGNDVDILPFLLLPLAGPEELSEEEMEGLPEDLQYLGDDKKREDDPDIRKMLIESVMQVCVCVCVCWD